MKKLISILVALSFGLALNAQIIVQKKELPSQTGQAGKYLTTNGSTPSWTTVSGGGGSTTTLTAGTNITLDGTTPTYTVNATTPTLTVVNGTLTGTYPTQTITCGSVTETTVGIGYINVKSYGAVGDGSTNDATAIQNAIDASITTYGDVRVYFPYGRYKVNTMLSVDNSTVNVAILGFNSTLVSGISTVGNSVIFIKQAKSVLISALSIDFNTQNTVHYGFRIGDEANSKYVGVCKIFFCDFYNFGTEATRGIFLSGTPFVTGLTQNFNLPSASIDNCNFYNQNTLSTMNYSTATYYGYGIQLGEKCDYTRIINCSFNFIRIAINSTAGGNTDITGCNFLGCMPKTSSVYTYGIINIPSGGTNNGKINIVACKFNHNYGYCIYWNNYATGERPLTISNCHFIANATTAIYATNTTTLQTRHIISNNYFERCSQAYTNSWVSQPFGASSQPFIYFNNQLRCVVRGNTFLNDGTYGITTAGSSDYIVIKQNTWYNITGMSSTVGSNNQISDNDNL